MTSTTMAGTVKDMSLIKQVIQLKQLGESNRGVSRKLPKLPYFREQLTNPKPHVTRQLLYEEYIKGYPTGYGKSQFYFHLKQNLVAQKDCTAVLTGTYNPGEKLMVDFAGDKLSYVDPETGEVIKVDVFVACMPYSDYTYVICVPSQRTEDFIFA